MCEGPKMEGCWNTGVLPNLSEDTLFRHQYFLFIYQATIE